MNRRVIEVAEIKSVVKVNELLKEGWELYKICSHHEKNTYILVKREKGQNLSSKETLFPDKEAARKTNILTSEQLIGLDDAQIAILIYYLISNGTRKTGDEIEVIGNLLSSVAIQSEKL